MSSELGTSSFSCAISSYRELDWNLCIICQESTLKKGTLVKNPKTESYQKLFNAFQERANLQDRVYVDIYGHLEGMSSEAFIESKPVWHCSCYSDATNAKNIQRARDHLEHTVMYTSKNRGHKRTRSKWMKQIQK